MPIESSGHSQGNPRLYELFENAPKTGKSPTVWAFPQLIDYLKVAGQPVQGPWPPHQQRRPDQQRTAPGTVTLAPPSMRNPAGSYLDGDGLVDTEGMQLSMPTPGCDEFTRMLQALRDDDEFRDVPELGFKKAAGTTGTTLDAATLAKNVLRLK